MPNGQHDTDPVTYGRWQEAHLALADRVTRLEDELRAAAPETTHGRLQAQLADLRADFDTFAKTAGDTLARRRDRQWALMITFLAGLALPLAVVAIVTLTHLH